MKDELLVNEPGCKDEKEVLPPGKKKHVLPAKQEIKRTSGWCECCKEAYDDFSQHIIATSHRSYATNAKNYSAVDELLASLTI